MSEVGDDPQVVANGYVAPIDYDGAEVRVMSAPVQFDGRVPQLRRAPEHAEHSEEVLLELGHDWAEITALKDSGVL
jgi:crotonobetainyl-CoA:carnitine CoA-transferase CaiB-like acyl-CoA transferase